MRIFVLLASAFSLLATTPAMALEAGGVLAELSRYEGPDREQLLVEGARREGHLVVYTSLTVDDMAVLENVSLEK